MTTEKSVNPKHLVAKARETWRLRRERGAVLVEAALAIPILLLVILGALEAGVAWEAKSSTTNALRSGVLRAATLADDPDTDLRVLQSIIGEIGAGDVDQLQYVVIYDVNAPASAITNCIADAGALSGGSGGEAGNCVTYGRAALQRLATTTDAAMWADTFLDRGSYLDPATGAPGCDPMAIDAQFCAARRIDAGDIEIGVTFAYDHDWLTGILPFDPPTFNEGQTSSTFQQDGVAISGSNVATAAGPVVANIDFSGSANPDVTITGASGEAAPNGEQYSGFQTAGDVITITIDNVRGHSEVCVSFDLHILGTWDGTVHDDAFIVDVGQDRANNNLGATGVDFQDRFEWRNDTSLDGGIMSSAENTLGFDMTNTFRRNNWNTDATFPISFCTPHSGAGGDSLAIDFLSTIDQAANDEAWAIDNVRVSVA